MAASMAVAGVVDEFGELAAARNRYLDTVSVYLDSGPLEETGPSTIVDIRGDEPVILRVGVIPTSAISEAFGKEVAVSR